MLTNRKAQIGIIVLMSLLYSSNLLSLGNAQMTHLKLEISTTSLTSDSNNYVTLNVYNDFVPIYELSISMYFTTSTQGSPTPSIIGMHSWTFDKVAVGDSVEIPVTIFAPKDTAGNAFTANVALTYKRLGYTSSITEGDTIGFYVQKEEEWIEIVFYEVEIEPDPTRPGASISISANILNKGNIPAMYTNLSLVENDILILQPESYTYLGQIDPNSPATFDVEALVNSKTKEGHYTAEIQVNYEDEDNRSYSISRLVPFNIVEIKEEEAHQGTFQSILGSIKSIFFSSSPQQGPPSSSSPSRSPSPLFSLFPGIVLIIIIVSIVVFVRRRRSKKNEFEEAFEDD